MLYLYVFTKKFKLIIPFFSKAYFLYKIHKKFYLITNSKKNPNFISFFNSIKQCIELKYTLIQLEKKAHPFNLYKFLHLWIISLHKTNRNVCKLIV